MPAHRIRGGLAALALLGAASMAYAHGDVAPQPMNTDALPDVGEEWLTENPYREASAGHEVWLKAVEIGGSGFNQNCARVVVAHADQLGRGVGRGFRTVGRRSEVVHGTDD